MILRLILVLLFIWAIYQLIRFIGKTSESSKDDNDQPERMLQCDYCGTHIPAHEAIHAGNKIYCSTRHRELDNAG